MPILPPTAVSQPQGVQMQRQTRRPRRRRKSRRRDTTPSFGRNIPSSTTTDPKVLEGFGVLRRSMTVHGDTLSLHTAATNMDQLTATTALVLYVVALLTMSVVLTKFLVGDRRATAPAGGSCAST